MYCTSGFCFLLTCLSYIFLFVLIALFLLHSPALPKMLDVFAAKASTFCISSHFPNSSSPLLLFFGLSSWIPHGLQVKVEPGIKFPKLLGKIKLSHLFELKWGVWGVGWVRRGCQRGGLAADELWGDAGASQQHPSCCSKLFWFLVFFFLFQEEKGGSCWPDSGLLSG